MRQGGTSTPDSLPNNHICFRLGHQRPDMKGASLPGLNLPEIQNMGFAVHAPPPHFCFSYQAPSSNASALSIIKKRFCHYAHSNKTMLGSHEPSTLHPTLAEF